MDVLLEAILRCGIYECVRVHIYVNVHDRVTSDQLLQCLVWLAIFAISVLEVSEPRPMVLGHTLKLARLIDSHALVNELVAIDFTLIVIE